jgi:chemotaxis protein histidine kinase CheA
VLIVSNQNISNEMINSLSFIRNRFIDGLADRIKNLDTLMIKVELRHDTDNALVEAEQEMHRITGVSGTLGFPVLGDMARAAEASLNNATSNKQNDDILGDAVAAVDEAVDVMSQIISSRGLL